MPTVALFTGDPRLRYWYRMAPVGNSWTWKVKVPVPPVYLRTLSNWMISLLPSYS